MFLMLHKTIRSNKYTVSVFFARPGPLSVRNDTLYKFQPNYVQSDLWAVLKYKLVVFITNPHLIVDFVGRNEEIFQSYILLLFD